MISHLLNKRQDEDSQSFTSDALEGPSSRSSSHFISLNEVMQSDHGRIEINSTEQRYHVSGDAGQWRSTTNSRLRFCASQGSQTQSQANTVHRLVRHGESSTAYGGSSTDRGHDLGMEDHDDLYAVSPILGESKF